MIKRTIDYFAYLVVRGVICVIQALPLDTCAYGSQMLAVLAHDILRIRRKVTKENLRLAFPDWTEEQRRGCVREMWAHLFLMICEIAHAPRKLHESNFRKHVQFHRKSDMIRYMLDVRPSLLVLGHFGNFEAAGFIAGLLGIPTFTIARDLDNPYLHKFINDFRSMKGQFMLPKEGSTGRIQEVIDDGGNLALLGDQSAGPKGCWVDFFGKPASCYKSLAVLTLVGGAPLVVMYCRRLRKPLHFEIGVQGIVDPADLPADITGVRELTQWYNHMLEDMIREAPGQYWWLHRRWKGEPPKRQRREKRIDLPAASGKKAA
ncbi:lysophospholipid acyltransferase family protein [Lignipirellula cremea]|uniref:Lipid A biosynthesis lauroyl acyltransferase n=1 Tax=Lignipirellula cremea TaxID=2528010 RepID=A0A518DP33_9BACT|nr:lysophospholipid acyltransferase family protein [Lignipirellula cremea]QDU93600.1 Lipid A biosynthesis lauroyl acyltransferase [Lignipirellula cremea]